MQTPAGQCWELMRSCTYDLKPTKQPGLNSSKDYWKSLEREWGAHRGSNGEVLGIYDTHDVVSWKGHFYCSLTKDNSSFLVDANGKIHWTWLEVYWFPEHSIPENRKGGWSSNKDQYVGMDDKEFIPPEYWT